MVNCTNCISKPLHLRHLNDLAVAENRHSMFPAFMFYVFWRNILFPGKSLSKCIAWWIIPLRSLNYHVPEGILLSLCECMCCITFVCHICMHECIVPVIFFSFLFFVQYLLKQIYKVLNMTSNIKTKGTLCKKQTVVCNQDVPEFRGPGEAWPQDLIAFCPQSRLATPRSEDLCPRISGCFPAHMGSIMKLQESRLD